MRNKKTQPAFWRRLICWLVYWCAVTRLSPPCSTCSGACILAEELEDDEAAMFLQITRGDAHKELGEASIAVEAYEQALGAARHRDDLQNEAFILYKLGMAYLDADETRRGD